MQLKWHAGASFLFYNKPHLRLGGGVGGINYACDLIDNSINYKHYNLRGDVIMTTESAGSVLSELWYTAYGEYEGFGALPSDKYRANTKVDDGELILDGHRYRNKALMRFMSPDPLEYIDGLNCYIYCSNNPWGRFDPDGLVESKGSSNIKNIRNNIHFRLQLMKQLGYNTKNYEERLKSGDEYGNKLVKGGSFIVGLTPAGAANEAISGRSADGESLDGIERISSILPVSVWGKGAKLGESVTKYIVSKIRSLLPNKNKLPVNPFKGKTAKQIADMLDKKGFSRSGPSPETGIGGWVNKKTGRSYHIDYGINKHGIYIEPSHIDVNRTIKGLNKKKIEWRIEDK